MNSIDRRIAEAARAVDRVEQRRFSSRHPEGRMTAEESADSLVRSQSRGESQPAPKPKWSPDDRARAARQLERAVRQFRRYAGRGQEGER